MHRSICKETSLIFKQSSVYFLSEFSVMQRDLLAQSKLGHVIALYITANIFNHYGMALVYQSL